MAAVDTAAIAEATAPGMAPAPNTAGSLFAAAAILTVSPKPASAPLHRAAGSCPAEQLAASAPTYPPPGPGPPGHLPQ